MTLFCSSDFALLIVCWAVFKYRAWFKKPSPISYLDALGMEISFVSVFGKLCVFVEISLLSVEQD